MAIGVMVVMAMRTALMPMEVGLTIITTETDTRYPEIMLLITPVEGKQLLRITEIFRL